MKQHLIDLLKQYKEKQNDELLKQQIFPLLKNELINISNSRIEDKKQLQAEAYDIQGKYTGNVVEEEKFNEANNTRELK